MFLKSSDKNTDTSVTKDLEWFIDTCNIAKLIRAWERIDEEIHITKCREDRYLFRAAEMDKFDLEDYLSPENPSIEWPDDLNAVRQSIEITPEYFRKKALMCQKRLSRYEKKLINIELRLKAYEVKSQRRDEELNNSSDTTS